MLRRALVTTVTLLAVARAPARADEPPPPPPPPADEAGGEPEGGPEALEEDPVAADATRAAAQDDPTFGPKVEIEAIQIVGNERTAERLVRRALLVREGDVLRTGDPRFKRSRFRVLALGYFYDVQLRLERGSARGKVVVIVEVLERGSFIVNRLYFGASEDAPLWLGFDVADGNVFGSGLLLGGALVWADAADAPGARDQWALRLRYGDPSVLGAPLSLSVEGLYNRASELAAVAAPEGFAPVSYTRAGGSVGLGWDLTRQVRALGQLRYEAVHVDVSAPPPSSHLAGAGSGVATLAVGLDRDTRADPVLTQAGDRAVGLMEIGGFPGDYEYVRLRARYERWFPLRGPHVISLHLGGGIVLGDPPGFDRFYIGDVDKLLAPRPLDLVVSTREPADLLGANVDAPLFGDVAMVTEVQYTYRLFRRTGHVYGGDLFVGAGVFGLWNRRDVDVAGERALDLSFDVGLRLDTEVGVFELSLTNALGRIPL